MYYLAPHVFMCETRDYPVLLDLKSDRYVAISSEDVPRLSRLVNGWPSTQTPAIHNESVAADQLITELLARGLLTQDGSQGKSATAVYLEPPQRSLIDGYEEIRAAVGLRDIAIVARSVMLTKALLRFTDLASVVARVKRISQRALQRQRSSEEMDKALGATYAHIRPLVFTSRKECMLDSFVMSEFLAARGSFAHCVFGVRSSPFAAHCWLQRDGIVFNDTPDYVSKFTPIMVV
jgi:hypothetical protein